MSPYLGRGIRNVGRDAYRAALSAAANSSMAPSAEASATLQARSAASGAAQETTSTALTGATGAALHIHGLLASRQNVLHAGDARRGASGVTAMTAGSGTSTSSTTSSSVRSTTIESPSALIAVTAFTEGTPRRAASCTSTCWAYSSAEPSPHRMRSKPPSPTIAASSSAVAGGIAQRQRVVGDHDQIVDPAGEHVLLQLGVVDGGRPHRHGGHRGAGVGSSQLGRRLKRVQVVGRHRPLRLGEVQGAIGGHLDVLIVGNHLECHCDLHFCTFLFKNFSHVSVRFKAERLAAADSAPLVP